MTNKENKLLAKISYAVYEDSPDIIIDIELDDYTDASIDALCSIIENVSSDAGVLNTINMIKDALIVAGEEEALLILLTKIGQNLVAKAESQTKNKDDDPPCILPSDML
tara:strand:+ start:956 stop:1282 length:327 start_codon:yes stop_codon:yes gene_type:complete